MSSKSLFKNWFITYISIDRNIMKNKNNFSIEIFLTNPSTEEIK